MYKPHRFKKQTYQELGEVHCFWCGQTLDKEVATVDHVKAQSLGGCHHKQNLVIACHRCNNLRGAIDHKQHKRKEELIKQLEELIENNKQHKPFSPLCVCRVRDVNAEKPYREKFYASLV